MRCAHTAVLAAAYGKNFMSKASLFPKNFITQWYKLLGEKKAGSHYDLRQYLYH
jgi:hypothetical protein